jgi:signal transduction histidine kinase
MHRILKRQIEKTVGQLKDVPPPLQQLLDLVSDTYDHFDEDRRLLDRSLSLSSAEFVEKSRSLIEAKERIEEIVHERTQELRKTQARLIASIESLSLGFLILDEKGSVFLGNKMFGEILGIDSVDNINQIDQKLEGKLRLKPMFDESLKSHQPINSRNMVFGKQAISVFVTPIALHMSKIIGAVVILEDSTKERQIDKAKTEFVSLASHQLRTPLTIVKWHTEAARNKIKNQPYEAIIKKNLDQINDGTKRMIALVQALLNASRIELGKIAIVPELLNLPEFTHNMVEELRLEIQEKNLRISEVFQQNLPKINADTNLLTIVIQNLLTNAIKYTPTEGRITITIEQIDSENLELIITDTGYGIPKSDQSKIFTKLFRADNVKLLKLGGTGLGLYITKSIVETAGGKISFTSPATDSRETPGCSFHVTLPLNWAARKDGSSLSSEDSDLLYT